jgi:hypothetical protein
MRDYHVIRGRADWFQPEDSLRLHQQSPEWLKGELNKCAPERTIVVTHHAPSKKSIPRVCFQGADQRLTQARFLGKRVAGNTLTFQFGDKEPDDFGADLVSKIVFGHTLPLLKKPLDGAYHYNDTQPSEENCALNDRWRADQGIRKNKM